MSVGIVRFTATQLEATGKNGVLSKTANGQYEICLGGLNIINSAGEFYVLSGAEDLFKSNSVLMRRIASGNLKGEEGHPKRQPGQSIDDYVERALRIEETNVSTHFSEIWLDKDYGKKLNIPGMQNVVGVLGLISPSGPKGDSVQRAIDNPNENLCYSIRATTKDYLERGQRYRMLTSVITWDHVTEPGIKIATKYNTLATESLRSGGQDGYIDFALSRESIERILDGGDIPDIGMEDSREIAREILTTFGRDRKVFVPPLSMKW